MIESIRIVVARYEMQLGNSAYWKYSIELLNHKTDYILDKITEKQISKIL